MTQPITPNPCMQQIPAMPIPPGLIPTLPAPSQPSQKPLIENFTPDPATSHVNQLWEIKILELVYFPLTATGDTLDINVTGDVGQSLADMRAHVETTSQATKAALASGCHNTIGFRTMGRIEIHEGYPLTRGENYRPGGYNPPLVDYNTMLKRFDIASWVKDKGVNWVWVWGYHGDVVTLWESTMSSPYGNISNSDRLKELPPVADKSYTLFNFNYGRAETMALESIGHQLEAIWNYIDGRDTTDENEWGKLLFWGKFVGSDKTHMMKPVNGVYRRGWMHYAPNSAIDYDWHNPRTVASDLDDWRPEGGGTVANVSAANWNPVDDGGLAWKIKWMQGIPRANNGLTYQGKAITNWWHFIGDFDGAIKAKMKLAV